MNVGPDPMLDAKLFGKIPGGCFERSWKVDSNIHVAVVADWSDNDADIVAFAARHHAVVELPEYDDGTRDSGSWPDDFDQVAPYR